MHTLTCITCVSISQEHIGARRSRRKAADVSCHRIESYYQRLRGSHESRGQWGARDAWSRRHSHTHRVRTSLMIARPWLAQQVRGRVSQSPRCFSTPPNDLGMSLNCLPLSLSQSGCAHDQLAARDMAHGAADFCSAAGDLCARAGTA
jgi:hypothetical protein